MSSIPGKHLAVAMYQITIRSTHTDSGHKTLIVEIWLKIGDTSSTLFQCYFNVFLILSIFFVISTLLQL